jgi:hypothetical protein
VVGGKRDAHTKGEEEQGAYSAGEQLDTVAGTLAAFAQGGQDIADYYGGDGICVGRSHGHGMGEHASQHQSNEALR